MLMHQNSRKFQLQLWHVYSLVAFSAMALLQLLPESTGAGADQSIGEAGKATLDLLTTIFGNITALNTALVGAAAALAVKGQEWSSHWERTDSVIVVFIFSGAAVVYYAIYLGHSALAGMVYKGVITPFEPTLELAMDLQYYVLLLGYYLLGLVFTRMLEQRRTAEEQADAAQSPREGGQSR